MYDSVAHTVTWDIGTIPAGGSGPTIELVVQVNSSAVPGTTLNNFCTIQYSVGGQDSETTVVDDEGSNDPDDEEGTPIGAPQPDLCPPEYRWSTTVMPPFQFSGLLFTGYTDVRFENSGSGDAFNVVATITCVPANVTVEDGTVLLGDIPAGGTAWSADSFGLTVDMSNPQDPSKGICWRVEYDDSAGVHHAVENVAKFCGENCSDICP